MQHAHNQVAGENGNNAILYVIDQDSGWGRDEDAVWVIDAGNEAEWENQVPYILD